jgi:uncharacterized surface protein with fasciclin (FAS1) repeats
MAIVAFASIGLAAGCSSAPSVDGATPPAAVVGFDETPIATTPIGTTSIDIDAPAPLPTLDALLAEDRFVALAVALERSGLGNVIDGLDDFVLLAPNGTAFATSGADIGIEYSTLMNDPRLLEAILRYHVVAPSSTNQSWRTLNGAALDVDGSTADMIERIDGVEVLDRIPIRNGTVLVMPRLLLPALGTSIPSTASEQDG